MKKIFLGLAIVACHSLLAQRVYFNEDWEVVKKEKEATYYRETQKQGKLTLIKDYYINGVLQFEGLASDTTPKNEVFEGKATWYYPNGKIESFSHYKNGMKVGEEKSYDEDGRVTKDFIYDAKGVYKGKEIFVEEYNNTKSLTEYENSNPKRGITYENSLQGIRIENIYDRDGALQETKYYGEGGKYIGTTSYGEGGYRGVSVEYYYNPMKVACISTSENAKISFVEQKCYYGNGKLKYEYKVKGNTAKSIVYGEDGKNLGELNYKYDEEVRVMTPYNGLEVGINLYEPEKEINYYTTYKDGSVLKNEWYEEGQLAWVTHHNGNGEIKEHLSYKDGKQVALLTYKDGQPYEGKIISSHSDTTYKKGIIVEEKLYDSEKNIISDKILNEAKQKYEAKIMEGKKLKYTYIIDFNEYGERMTGEITPYDKSGKPMNKIIVKDGLIEKGKLRITLYDDYEEEFERKGDWLYRRTYEGNKLTSERKDKVGEKDYEHEITEALLIDWGEESHGC